MLNNLFHLKIFYEILNKIYNHFYRTNIILFEKSVMTVFTRLNKRSKTKCVR